MSRLASQRLENSMPPSSLKLPLIGLGTRNPMNNIEELKSGLRAAFDAGYRYVDTAYIYYNETIIGDVLQEYYDSGKLRRSDVFICSKLPCFAHNPRDAEQVLKESLHALRTDYIDLYLIHHPTPLKRGSSGAARGTDGRFLPDLVPHIVTWTFMEKFYKAGVLRFIGLSNFNQDQIEDICRKAEVMPHHLQVELHMLHRQKDLVGFCRKEKISLTAYSPLGSPGRPSRIGNAGCLQHPLVLDLSQKYKKTPAQILLRHLVQLGISVIPKTTNPKRAQENINIFDFELTPDDMQLFDMIEDDVQLYCFEFAQHHPWYPFHRSRSRVYE